MQRQMQTHQRKIKNVHSMPLRFKFKTRWHPPLPSFISFPESSFSDCWSWVTRTLGTRLSPSWDTEMPVHISSCLRLHLTCQSRLCWCLPLCRKCEPALTGLNAFPLALPNEAESLVVEACIWLPKSELHN